jgi:hypothetical protein
MTKCGIIAVVALVAILIARTATAFADVPTGLLYFMKKSVWSAALGSLD